MVLMTNGGIENLNKYCDLIQTELQCKFMSTTNFTLSKEVVATQLPKYLHPENSFTLIGEQHC